jgi:subtilisin-like proprotein convertase family protein
VNSSPEPLLDDHLAESSIGISGLPADMKVVSVDVRVDITHPRVSDLCITLIDPALSNLKVLWNFAGGSTANLQIWWYDLQDWFGRSASGTWTLSIFDSTTGNEGYLSSWTIKVYYALPRTALGASDTFDASIPENGSIDAYLLFDPAPRDAYITGIDTHVVISHPTISELRISLWSASSLYDILWARYGEYMSDMDRWWYNLDTFNGAPVSNLWHLQIIDEVPGNQGWLRSWRIRVYYAAPDRPSAAEQTAEMCSQVGYFYNGLDWCPLRPQTPQYAQITGVDLRTMIDSGGGTVVTLRLGNAGARYLLDPEHTNEYWDRWWRNLSVWNGLPAGDTWYLTVTDLPDQTTQYTWL